MWHPEVTLSRNQERTVFLYFKFIDYEVEWVIDYEGFCCPLERSMTAPVVKGIKGEPD